MVKQVAGSAVGTGPSGITNISAKNLTLEEALQFFGDAGEIAEMLHLKSSGYSGPQMFFVDAPFSESERKQLRYHRLRRNVEGALRAKLVSGDVIATGRDLRDEIDGPRIKVPPELWRTLVFDFQNSTASADGLVITHILVPAKGGLHLWRASRRARLGAVELKLSPQSHGLLLALAQKVLDGGTHIETETLRSNFFSNRNDIKAVNQGLGTLRKQMINSGLEKKTVASLILPVRTTGYALGLPVEEIAIER